MVVPEKIAKIKILQAYDSTNLNNYISKTNWKNASQVHYTKYNIKETDMRIKTASFTSPEYVDLTTGQYFVLIASKYHENFAGYILDVEYDPNTGLYTYQCQDFSRNYMAKVQMVRTGTQNIYNQLVSLLTHFEIDKAYKKIPKSYSSKYKVYFKNVLSGLRPLWRYDQSIYEGNNYKGNPFKKTHKMIMRDKSYIEIIRALVFGSLGYFDVYFNERGILQIEPLSKKDWESTGLHLTMGNTLNSKYKFSTTNAITRVVVNGTGLKSGKDFSLNDIQGNLDLSMFFGRISTSIANPVKETKKTKSNNSNSNSELNKDNPYGTKNKEVWITIDNIFGQSADRKIMDDFAAQVQKAGWKTHVGGVGPSYHYAHAPGYSWSGQVNNAVWFVIYGGACAGTLNEAATATWYRKPLVDRGSRTVVGFIHPPCGDIRKGGKYYSWLPRAHDDNFSPSSFTGLSNPGEFLTNKGIPWMYAKDGKSLANIFLQGGDNPEACNKNWKWY